MTITITIESKSSLFSDETLKGLLVDMMAKGEPLPPSIVKQLHKTGRASYETEWVRADRRRFLLGVSEDRDIEMTIL